MIQRRPCLDILMSGNRFAGKVVSVSVERVILPNGEQADLDIVRHPGGSAVVALDEDGRVCLLRQYRHAAGGWLWELPAGKRDGGEAPETTARRELAEEAGVAARDWRDLGTVVSSPGVFTEVVHLYLARGLAPAAATREHGEVFETHWVPLGEAVARALSGDIVDGKTVIGLLRAGHAAGLHGGGRDAVHGPPAGKAITSSQRDPVPEPHDMPGKDGERILDIANDSDDLEELRKPAAPGRSRPRATGGLTPHEVMARLLDGDGLSVDDAAPPPAGTRQIGENRAGLKKGYDPYESGMLSKGEPTRRKRDLRALSGWIKAKKNAESKDE